MTRPFVVARKSFRLESERVRVVAFVVVQTVEQQADVSALRYVVVACRELQKVQIENRKYHLLDKARTQLNVFSQAALDVWHGGKQAHRL